MDTFGNLLQRETRLFFFMALCAAVLIAAGESALASGVGIIGVYAYWVTRILTEAMLFFAFREVVERYLLPSRSVRVTGAVACGLSLVPFVLAITAFDLVLGYPELGMQSGDVTGGGEGRLVELGLELIYLSDNHLALCLLLSVPRLFRLRGPAAAEPQPDDPSILNRLDPRLKGDVLWLAAQEHYVQITTTREVRTELYRFSDLVRDVHPAHGMQVHRSHWVAFAAITDMTRAGQSTRITLTTGDTVPVSRTYRARLEEHMGRKFV